MSYLRLNTKLLTVSYFSENAHQDKKEIYSFNRESVQIVSISFLGKIKCATKIFISTLKTKEKWFLIYQEGLQKFNITSAQLPTIPNSVSFIFRNLRQEYIDVIWKSLAETMVLEIYCLKKIRSVLTLY